MKLREIRRRNTTMNAFYYGWPTRKKERCSTFVAGCFRCSRFHFFDRHGRWPNGWEAEDHQAKIVELENALVQAKHPEYTEEVVGRNPYYKIERKFTILNAAGNAYVQATVA